MATDMFADADMVVDRLAPPDRMSHEVGLITESSAKFAAELNVLVHFERFVYDEDSLAVLPKGNEEYPEHDLFLVRTGGMESLRTTTSPVVVFAPWAEDDLLMAVESNSANYATYSDLNFIADDSDTPSTLPVFVTGDERSWLAFPDLHAEGVQSLAEASTTPGAVAITRAEAGSFDAEGGTFAGARLGIYTAFRRDLEAMDSKPAFGVWTAAMWRYYTIERERFLSDSVDSTYTAVLLHDGTPGIAVAMFETRLRRLGFDVVVRQPGELQGEFDIADLVVLWPDLTDSVTPEIPAGLPVISLAGDPDLLARVGLFVNATGISSAIENRWSLAVDPIVPVGSRGRESVVVNDSVTTLALPAASVASVPATALSDRARVLASLTENGNTTAFVVNDGRRGGFVSMDLDTFVRAQPEVGRLLDRMILWLVTPEAP